MDIAAVFGEMLRIAGELWQGWHAVGVLAGILVFIFTWRAKIRGWLFRSRQDYYRALIWRDGAPAGLGKLSKRQHARRHVSFASIPRTAGPAK